MIHQGTDGLLRGLMTDGMFSSDPMKLHIPLHLSALDRCPSLLPWFQSWCPDLHISSLTPEGWFTVGHGTNGFTLNTDGIPVPEASAANWFLWAPPPAAGHYVMEELATSHHKRPFLNHIFVCPRFFTSQWRRCRLGDSSWLAGLLALLHA